MDPHTTSKGEVFIPHREGQKRPDCQLGCSHMTDGIRHHPDCQKVIAWKAALANVRTKQEG